MFKKVFTKEYFEAAFIRAYRTFIQVFVTSMPVEFFTLGSVEWKLLLSASAAAAIFAFFMGLLFGLPEVDKNE